VCSAQAVEFHRPLEPGPGTGAALRALRERVPFLDEDRDVSSDIVAATTLVAEGTLVEAAAAAVGALR
jgi:histidine ammonia-lyase